ncbi:unnamed protein product, partial [Brassica rapa]
KFSGDNSFSKKQRCSRVLKEYVLSLRFLLIVNLFCWILFISYLLRDLMRSIGFLRFFFLNRSFIYCCSDPGKRLTPYGIIVEIEDKCESLT